jgi:hypothetical protein
VILPHKEIAEGRYKKAWTIKIKWIWVSFQLPPEWINVEQINHHAEV